MRCCSISFSKMNLKPEGAAATDFWPLAFLTRLSAGRMPLSGVELLVEPMVVTEVDELLLEGIFVAVLCKLGQ